MQSNTASAFCSREQRIRFAISCTHDVYSRLKIIQPARAYPDKYSNDARFGGEMHKSEYVIVLLLVIT